MIQKIGKCTDAFNIKNRGVVLGYFLYCAENIPHETEVIGKVLENGKELFECTMLLGYVFGGKRARYDMEQYSIRCADETKDKKDFIGREVYLLCEYDFLQQGHDE